MNSLDLKDEWLGLVDYKTGFEAQETAHQAAKINGAITAIGLEHKPVVTLGLRASRHADILNLDGLVNLGYEIQNVTRGGLATLHNPGQLVVYSIVSLKLLGLGVREYVCLLLRVTKHTLEHFGIESMIESNENPGIYSKKGKIAFIGIQIKSGVTMHGVSININNNLKHFGQISACGMLEQNIDSTKENIGKELSLEDVFKTWKKYFIKELG